MAKKEKTIHVTIRFPESLWRKIKLAIIDGKVKSIQQAVVEGLRKRITADELNILADVADMYKSEFGADGRYEDFKNIISRLGD